MFNNGTRLKILYIEDDEFQRLMVSLFLNSKGFETEVAANGYEGVALALEWTPDLILTDLMMPVMDGFQAATALRANPRTSHIPIIALSAVPPQDITAKIAAAGINELLQKPSSPSSLLDKLRVYLLENGAKP